MSRLRLCACGHDIDTHFKDLSTGQPGACLGMRCDCKQYYEGDKSKKPVLPANNYDESKTASWGGRPHLSCQCQQCVEWEFEQMRKQLGW